MDDCSSIRGDYTAAEAAFRAVLARHEVVFGPGHFATARVLNNLGEVLYQQGRYQESLEHLERAICTTTVGADHRVSTIIRINLDQAHRMLKALWILPHCDAMKPLFDWH